MSIYDYPKTRAVVIERPFEAALREIQLTVPREDAYISRTTWSAISTGTDMKTYRGMQHPEQCWYPLVPGYETGFFVGPTSLDKVTPDMTVGDREIFGPVTIIKRVKDCINRNTSNKLRY